MLVVLFRLSLLNANANEIMCGCRSNHAKVVIDLTCCTILRYSTFADALLSTLCTIIDVSSCDVLGGGFIRC